MTIKRKKPALMIQATGSNAGKSIFCAGLCRLLTRRGLKIRPFKPQNMSNNAGLTIEGGEIGRAQILQAQAAKTAPSVHMNPILLKPESEKGAQLVIRGKMQGRFSAQEYYKMKKTLLPVAIESFTKLEEQSDMMIIEGAGSPAEINLRENDIANMGFAEALSLPVVLLADIDRGGVIASIIGTDILLSPDEKKLLCGYIINKFRGDSALFDKAHDALHQKTGLPSFGMLPFMPFLKELPEEDSLPLSTSGMISPSTISSSTLGEKLHIVVLHLPRMANFNDFDPLIGEDNIRLSFLQPGEVLPPTCHLVILPGSKSVFGDLEFIRKQGWDIDILAHIRRGGGVIGICGGYQMMGKTIHDPKGIEGIKGSIKGLGILDISTELTEVKTLTQASGTDTQHNQHITGYEMHIGKTTGKDCQKPMLCLETPKKKYDGACAEQSGIMGCYLHGLFDQDGFRQEFLSAFASGKFNQKNNAQRVENALDHLADAIEEHCRIEDLLACAHKNL
jgi:adenosylcobyric acid synthase